MATRETVNQVSANASNASKTSRYRPEIDGLRAFAVVAVIINHFNKDILPGGYLGVDIFFVISGYVITSSLFGRPSKDFKDFITGFYERRIKRLIPALVVFIVITCVLISLFDPNPQIALRTGSASLFGLSNLYLLKQSTDYFAQSTELNPFVHTWSLGVEEQFYLLFPVLIWFSGFGKQSAKGSRNLFFWIGILTVASLTSFIYLYQFNQPAAYFLMPSRFWEMSAGCLLFIGFQKRTEIERSLEHFPPLLVVAAIVAVMFFPVSAAVPATIGMVILTAVLIACLKKGTSAYNFFTLGKVVYIGLISYSLYLWHWSILSISRWTIGIHWWSIPIQSLAILCAAILSNNLIEKPFRQRRWSKSSGFTIAYGIVIASISAASIYLSRNYSQFIFLGKVDLIWDGISSAECLSGKQFSKQELISSCTLPPKKEDTPSLISIGDSQTAHLLPLLNRLNAETGAGIMYYTHMGLNFPSIRQSGMKYHKTLEEFDDRYERLLNAYKAFIDSAREGDIIILSSKFVVHNWGLSQEPNTNGELSLYFDESNLEYTSKDAFLAWKESLKRLTGQASQKGIRTVLFTSFPGIYGEIPKCLSDPQWFNDFNWCVDETLVFSRNKIAMQAVPVNSYLKNLASTNPSVYLFDQFNTLCPTSSDKCIPSYTRDGIHLSRIGASTLYGKFRNFLSANKLLLK